MAVLYGFTAPCLVGVVFLHKAKQDSWLRAVSTHKFLLHRWTAHRFAIKVPILEGHLSRSPIRLFMGIVMRYLWE